MSIDQSISKASLQPVEKPVILIVDDSRVIRLALKKILKNEFILHEAGDGEEAWTALMENSTIQVIFSDLSMPELDGFGLLERIRKSEDERICKLPLIVITGNEDDETILQRALDNGANDLITKPFQSKEIKERAYAFARKTESGLVSEIDDLSNDISTDTRGNIALHDQAINEEKRSTEVEREVARLKEENELRRKATEETTARIKEEAEKRRKLMDLDENILQEGKHDENVQTVSNAVNTANHEQPGKFDLNLPDESFTPVPSDTSITGKLDDLTLDLSEVEGVDQHASAEIEAEALRRLDIAEEQLGNKENKDTQRAVIENKEMSAVEERIKAEVEARKKAEEELAILKQKMDGKKDMEGSSLELQMEENTRLKADTELTRLKVEHETADNETVVATGVKKTGLNTIKSSQSGDHDERQNEQETEMIRIELKKKLQLEREQQKQTSGSFFMLIVLSVLGIINYLPGIKLDNTINKLRDRISS